MRLSYSTPLLCLLLLISCSKADQSAELPEGRLELVWAVQPEGIEDEQLEEPWFARINDVAVSGNRICVLDYGRGIVMQLDQSGLFLRNIGGPGEGPGEFGSSPNSVSVSPNGDIFVYHWRGKISKFSNNGIFIERLDFQTNPIFIGRVAINHFALNDSTIVWTVGPSRSVLEIDHYLNEPFLIATQGSNSLPVANCPLTETELEVMDGFPKNQQFNDIRSHFIGFSAGTAIRGPNTEETIFVRNGDPYTINRFTISQPPISFSFHEPYRDDWISEISMDRNDLRDWELGSLLAGNISVEGDLLHRYAFTHTARGIAQYEDKLAVLVLEIPKDFQPNNAEEVIEQYVYLVDINDEQAVLRTQIDPPIPQLELKGALGDGTLIFSTNDPVPGILAYRIVD